MYVVLVTHRTGHGEVTSPVLLTTDSIKAVNMARNAREGHGFRFDRECSISVVEMVPEAIYVKHENGTVPSGPDVRYLLIERPKFADRSREAALSGWEEEWIDMDFWRKHIAVYQNSQGILPGGTVG